MKMEFTGSEKQIAWAKKIYQDRLDWLEKFGNEQGFDETNWERKKTELKDMEKFKQSSFWIDGRNCDWFDFHARCKFQLKKNSKIKILQPFVGRGSSYDELFYVDFLGDEWKIKFSDSLKGCHKFYKKENKTFVLKGNLPKECVTMSLKTMHGKFLSFNQ